MKNGFFEKVVRCFRFNRMITIKVLGIVVSLVLLGVQNNILADQERSLTRVKKERRLVKQISKMEKELRSKNLKLLEPAKQLAAIRNILEGTSFRDDVYHAVIDGEVYSTGDDLGDYTIAQINLETIILENPARDEVKELRFPSLDKRKGKK